ncbi:MAG: hypothetical protein R3C56_33615 [Pirellulaceae bacterium]
MAVPGPGIRHDSRFYWMQSHETDSSTAAPPISEVESSSHDQTDHDHADHDHEGEKPAGKTDMEKMAETLASFSDEDRQSAMKQHLSGERRNARHDGGTRKVEVDGQSVWICCEACKDKLLAALEKYLTKLSK